MSNVKNADTQLIPRRKDSINNGCLRNVHRTTLKSGRVMDNFRLASSIGL